MDVDHKERESATPAVSVSDDKSVTGTHASKWVEEIDKELEGCTGVHDETVETSPSIFPVREQVRKMKPEHFNPEYIFMGLLHKKKYASDPEPHRSHEFRVNMVKAFLGVMKSKYDWKKLCSEVVHDPAKFQRQYGRNDLHWELVQRSLTLDAVFLMSYLVGYLYPDGDGEMPALGSGRMDPDIKKNPKLPFSTKPFTKLIFTKGLAFHNIVANDITKLENQIPLSLLRTVLEILCRGHPIDSKTLLDEICYKVVKMISFSIPGFIHHHHHSSLIHSAPKDITVDFANEDHLLGCVCSIMVSPAQNTKPVIPRFWSEMRRDNSHSESHCSSWGKAINDMWERLGLGKRGILRLRDQETARRKGSEIPDEENMQGSKIPDEENMQTISLPSITKLYEGGIECRGEERGKSEIEVLPKFKKGLLKGTLYIPTFSILYRTELLWRNMAAYEAAKLRLDDHFTSQFICFLKFMNELIDTEDDVALLRQGRNPVIPKSRMGTEKDLADLFNEIVHNYMSLYKGSSRWLDLRREIDEFYQHPRRRLVLDFLRSNFGKPWLVVSVFAATLLLVLTVVQTVYTILAYY